MTLMIGILVDDSIVVLENIERHYHEGEAAAVAAVNGLSQIGVATIVITLVIVVVFSADFVPAGVGRPLLARVRAGRDGGDADLALRLVRSNARARGPVGALLPVEAVGDRRPIHGRVRTSAPLVYGARASLGPRAPLGGRLGFVRKLDRSAAAHSARDRRLRIHAARRSRRDLRDDQLSNRNPVDADQ